MRPFLLFGSDLPPKQRARKSGWGVIMFSAIYLRARVLFIRKENRTNVKKSKSSPFYEAK